MADTTEQLEQQPVNNAKVATHVEKVKVERSRHSLWFGVFILLTVISAAGAGYYLLSQLREKQEGLGGEVKGELSKQVSDYQAQLAAIQSQIAILQSDVNNKNSHVDKTLEEFTQVNEEQLAILRKDLTSQVQDLQHQMNKTRGDWLLADADYLLSVANQRLLLMGDVNTTREALEAADQRLRESGDAGAFKVREQLAKEIIAVKNVNVADVVGIYATLQVLADEIDKLSLLLPYSGKEIATQKNESKKPIKIENASDLIEQLETVVTVRHTNQPIKEILTPEQAQFIREQLRVKLEMIKVAIVQQNDALYQVSLNDTKKWITQNFAKDKEHTRFISEIDKLIAIKIRADFPDISLSLKMLRDISKLRLEADKAMQVKSNESVKTVETPTVPENTQ